MFKDFVIFVRDSQISTQIDLPINYCSDRNRTYHANRRKRCDRICRIFCATFWSNRDFTRLTRAIVCGEVVCTKTSSFSSIKVPRSLLHVHNMYTLYVYIYIYMHVHTCMHSNLLIFLKLQSHYYFSLRGMHIKYICTL